jgi:hypothetical protein
METGLEVVIDQIMAVAQDNDDDERESPGKRLAPKRVGEIGEMEFIKKAIRKGFSVSKPWGDSDRYDAITDWNGTLRRVQIRATESPADSGYLVHASVYVGDKSVGLTKEDIDVLAAYIFPKDLWYIVPVEGFVPLKNLWLSPESEQSRFEKFREAWDWLRGKRWRSKPSR